MRPLVSWMDKTDQVRIVGPTTDLTFSIKGIPTVPCDGKLNIPDGEVFTAPVRDSVNGTLQFNARTICQGVAHDNVRLEFFEGGIVKATNTNTEHLGKVLDADEGTRYIGEFAIGLNPYITEPMLDILFDEKIALSFHLTPGQAYDEAENSNLSTVHWDLVCLQTQADGGGEIWFDGALVRKDGLFVVEGLTPLNPDNLK
jgi:aminopeptidase